MFFKALKNIKKNAGKGDTLKLKTALKIFQQAYKYWFVLTFTCLSKCYIKLIKTRIKRTKYCLLIKNKCLYEISQKLLQDPKSNDDDTHKSLRAQGCQSKVIWKYYQVNANIFASSFSSAKENISCKKETSTNVKLDVKLTMWWQLG